MSLVWIAGPMSGTLGQPIVGVLSDELRWSYGRRRPFMIGGAAATIFSLLGLSWSLDIVGFLTGAEGELLKQRTIPFAVVFVYLLDFSISVIQAAARAFIVDNVPTYQQQVANAWAARMIGIGNIVGFVLGSVNLPKLFPWLGNTQFKVLSACACLALVFTVGPACIGIKEQDPNTDPTIITREGEKGVVRIWSDTMRAIRHLSPQTRLACEIEFFAWIGYFPMLFYSSTYVGILYTQQQLREQQGGHVGTPERNEEATRQGSMALLAFAIVSLGANFVLPYLSFDSYDAVHQKRLQYSHRRVPATRGFNQVVQYMVRYCNLTVNKLWIIGHVVFVFATISTFWIKTSHQAMIFVGVLGIPWAIALWAPFVIISEEVARIKQKKTSLLGGISNETEDYQEQAPIRRNFETYEHEAGIILGVHNVFVALPQVVSSLMASLLFKILDSHGQVEGQPETESADGLGWVFRFGGLATLVAVYLSCKLKTKSELDVVDEEIAEN